MSISGAVAAAIRKDEPYQGDLQLGAQLILDFRGVRTGGRPYYWYRGTRYATPEKIPGWSFSRASGGYAETRSGRLVWFGDGSPRITDRGFLIEESRTNLCVQSGNPVSSSWDGAGVTKSPGQPDPVGGLGAALVAADGTNGGHTFFPASTGGQIAYTSGSVYTFSRFVKAGSQSLLQFTAPGTIFGSGQYANFNLATGQVTFSVGLAGAGVQILPLADGWYRIAITVQATTTGSQSGGSVVFITTATDPRVPGNTLNTDYYDFGAQVELGVHASSYVPAAAAAATRAADIPYIAGLTPILIAPFTLQASADFIAGTGISQRLVSVNDGTGNNVAQIAKSGAGAVVGQSTTAGSVLTSAGLATAGQTIRKAALRQRPGDFRFVVEGGAYGPNVASAPIAPSRLDLGLQTNAAHLNGYLQRVVIYGDVNDDQLTRLAA